MTSQPQGEKPKLKISRCRHDTGRTFIETIEEETVIATITDPSSEMWQLAQQLVSVWNASLESCDQPATPGADEESATPRTDEVAKAIGSLAAAWKMGQIYVEDFMVSAQFEINKLGELERELASLQSERDELRAELSLAQDAIETANKNNIGWRRSCDDLRAELAERDERLNSMTAKAYSGMQDEIKDLRSQLQAAEEVRDMLPRLIERLSTSRYLHITNGPCKCVECLRDEALRLLARLAKTNPTK